MRRIAGLLLLVLGASGCVVIRVPPKPKPYLFTVPPPAKIYQETVVSLKVERVMLKIDGLSEEFQTVGVHPDDAGFLTGETTTDVKEGESYITCIGVEQQIGTPHWRFTAGLDSRQGWFNLPSDMFEGYYDECQQSSDHRPPSQGSFVYSAINWGPLNAMPHVGFSGVFHPPEGPRFHFALTAGYPYGVFEAVAGHRRFGTCSPVRRDSWSGFGRSFGAEVGGGGEFGYLTFGAQWESYEAEFAGQRTGIEGWALFLSLIDFRWDD